MKPSNSPADIRPPAPIVEEFYDEFDEQGDSSFEKFQKTEDLSFLKAASDLYRKSKNPEADKKADLLLGLFYILSSRKETDQHKSVALLKKADDFFIQAVGEEGEERLKIRLEFLKKKRELDKDDTLTLIQTFQELAETYKLLGNEKDYHAEMALYYLFSLREIDFFDVKHEETLSLLISHAKESGLNELMFKAKAIQHQFKAMTSGDFSVTQKELQEALSATNMTTDKFGIEEIKAKLKFAEAMLTTKKKKRDELLKEVAEDWKKLGNTREEFNARNLASDTPIKITILQQMLTDTLKSQQDLNKKIHELIQIKPGSYKLFHHHSHLLERIKDLEIILGRLGESRKKLTELAIKEERLRPKKIVPGRPFSKRLQKVLRDSDRAKQQMKLDLESLYIYGNLILDQWAYVIGHLIGTQLPDFNFEELAKQLQKDGQLGALKILTDTHFRDAIWLYYQIRRFRNIFIEHVRDPWQRGSSMSVYGDDFNLFIPSPVGWMDESVIQQSLESIKDLAPDFIKNAPDEYWEKKNLRRTLEVSFARIEDIPSQSDRERLWDVWKKIGGSTPSYDVVAFRLARFLVESTKTVIEIIKKDPAKINLGEPEHSKVKL